MGYIIPNGVIQIFKGINLDNRYMHTIYFASETEQNTYFTGKLTNSGKQFTEQYYTRHNGGVIRLRVPCDDILEYTSFSKAYCPVNTDTSIYHCVTIEEDERYMAELDAKLKEME